MTRRFPFILICLAVLAIALSSSVSSGGTPMDRGSAWLVQAQNADGSWGRRLDLQATAFSILALEAAGRDCAADRALLRRLDCDSPYEIALQLLAVRDPAMADRLLACQDPDGGWGDPYTTALGLIGLARAGRANPAAAAWLLARRNQDGSFGLQGTNEATAVVTYALLLAGQAGDMTGLSLAWLRGHQAPQGGWTHPTATAWAVLALRAAGGYGEEIARAAAWLRETQLPDGAWGWGKEPRGALYPTALAVLALATLDSADPAAAAGAEYLLAGRGEEGGWHDEGLAAGTTLRAAEILSALGRTEGLGAAASWLAKLEARHQEARAARFSFLLRYGSISPEDRDGTLAALQAAENPAGGWGCEAGYESDLLTTSEVLRALWDAGHADPGVYRRSLDFLRSRQRADGGFNLGPSESGQVYVTAHLLLTLVRLRPLVAVDGVVEPAMAWLLAQRQPDGSWGRGALDTAIAFAAAADRLSGAEAELTRRYLELAQEPDGSWGGDDLATALALAALDLIKPNLRATADGIAFDPAVVYFHDQASARVTVANTGLAAAENVEVRLYLGKPESGTLLGAQVLASIPAKGYEVASFAFRADTVWDNLFTAIVDPEGTIEELREGDNEAARNLQVLPRIDLAVSAADLHIAPDDPSPADELTITAVVRNGGRLPAGAFRVVFYDGEPEAGGAIIGTADCAGVEPQGTAEVSISATLTEGDHGIHAVVDPENAVAEDDEGNNRASVMLAVQRRIDLAISYYNVIFSDDAPFEGDLVTIYATVVNKREDAADAVSVAFYRDNPADGGILLNTATIDRIEGNGNALAACVLDTAGLTGRQVLYVVADPDEIITEVDEHNNQAIGILYITARPDLIVSSISTGTMREGAPGSITISMKNQGGSASGACAVRISLDDPTFTEVLCPDVSIGAINPGSTTNLNLTMDTVNRAGAHVVYVKIDAANKINEADEENNTAVISFTIAPAPELSVPPDEILFTTYTKRLAIEHTATSDDSYIYANDANGANYTTANAAKLPTAGGAAATISVWAKGATGGEQIQIHLFEYRTPTGSGVSLANQVFNLTTEWRQYTLTAQTSAAAMAVWGRLDNDLNGQVVWWCDPHLYNADFIDGFAFLNTDNSLWWRFFTPANGTMRPDFSALIPEAIHQGDRMAATVLVRNNTSAQAENVPVRLYRFVDGQWQPFLTKTMTFPGDKQTSVWFAWDAAEDPGTSLFKVAVDPDLKLYERDKTNNSAEAELTILPAEMPDLTVVQGSIASHPAPAARDGLYVLRAEIANLRAVAAGEVLVRFYRGNPLAGGMLIGEDVVAIGAGGSAAAETAWDTAGISGSQSIYVWADPANTVAEYDDYNNLASAPFRLRANPLYQPQNLQAEAVLSEVNLSWDPVEQPDVVGYMVYRDEALISSAIPPVRGSARASSQYSSTYAPQKAIDGNTGTYWMSSSFSTVQWLEEEFSSMQFVQEIEIAWHTSYIGRDYQIQVWNGDRYETVLSVTGNTTATRTHKLPSAGAAVSRYRIHITRTNSSYVGILEVKLKTRVITLEPSYIDSGLLSGDYSYTVTALNQQGEESLPSASVSVTVLPPAAPEDFAGEVLGPDVQLSWQPSAAPDCIGYYLRRDGVLLGGTEPAAGTATASGYYSSSYTPDKAIDGNESSHWYCSLGTGCWWQMNLAEERYAAGITISWRYVAQEFQILGLKDGIWTTLADIKGNTLSTTSHSFGDKVKIEALRIAIAKSSHAYIGIYEAILAVQERLTGHSYLDANLKAGTYEYKLTAENSLFCESARVIYTAPVAPPAAPADLQAVVIGSDVALSWRHEQGPGLSGYLVLRNGLIANRDLPQNCVSSGQVSASSWYSSTYEPAKAVDGDPGTYWLTQSSGFPAWYRITFKEPKILSGLRLVWQGSYYGRDYQIQYRADGEWRPIATVTGNQSADLTHNFTHPILTDSIRIYCTAGARTTYLGITELLVYENALIAATNYQDTMVPDGSHVYSVIARDKAGNQSVPSDPIEVVIGVTSSPFNLIGTVTNNQVALQWEVASLDGIAGFRIYRDYAVVNPAVNTANTATATVSHNTSTAARITDNNLSSYWQPGSGAYPSWVELSFASAVEVSKVGVHWSADAYAARDYDLLAWVNEAWVTVAQIRGNTVANNEIADGMILTTDRLRLALTAGPAAVRLAELRVYRANLVKELFYTETVLENGTYTYHVRAVSETNALSELSNIVLVEVAERVPPAAPQGFRASEISGYLRLEWTANAEADLAGYYVYLGESSQPLNSTRLAQTTVQYDYSLPTGVREFEFRLVAVDLNGNRGEPAVTSYICAVPSPPSNPKAVVTGRNVAFTWSASQSQNILSYKVYRNGVLCNALQRVNPIAVVGSSVYFGSGSYAPANVNDQNEATSWRPAIDDPAPSLELRLDAMRPLSAIGFVWHTQDETPSSYRIEAFVEGSWVVVFTADGSARRTIHLPQTLPTDRIRLAVTGTGVYPGLAEFTCYEAKVITGTSHNDQNLSPGIYNYQVSAVSRAGLDSPLSDVATAEISARDLSIKTGDLYYSPYRPSVFDEIVLQAKVINTGTQAVGETPVAFYAGDPASGGVYLGEALTLPLAPGQDGLVSYAWNPEGFAGDRVIYVKIDPRNELNEFNETNNVTSRSITITQSAVLETTVVEVKSEEFPRVKVALQVSDAMGEGVAGLQKANFSLAEDGIPQNIINLTSVVDDSTGLARIDLVFVIDTSGSMSNEWVILPDILRDLIDNLTMMGIDLRAKVYALYSLYSGTSNIPTIEALKTGIFNGSIVSTSQECWGPGTAWVAQNYQWREGAYRIVIPISDENCYRGSGQDENDLASIAEAVALCQLHSVEAYPFYGTTDTHQSVKDEMLTLAAGTGGEMFHYEEANQIINYLLRVFSRKKVHYQIEYDTTNIARDGTTRDVTIDASYRAAAGGGQGQYRAPQDQYGDLVVARFESDPVAAAGRECALRAAICNIGGIGAENVPVEFFLGQPGGGGVLLAAEVIPSLAPNTEIQLSTPWPAKAGTHRLYVVVDRENTIAETDESNNEAYLDLDVPGRPQPDLLILGTELFIIPASPSCGQRIEIKARIRNIGAGSGPAAVGFYLGDPGRDGILLKTIAVPALDYLGWHDAVCTWTAGHVPGDFVLHAVADPLNAIEESDEENNAAHSDLRLSQSPIGGWIETDKESYRPQEDVLLTAAVLNNLSASWSGEAKVIIRDAQGREIAQVGFFHLSLPSASETGPGEWRQNLAWNVDSLAPGNYQACLQLLENGDRIAEYTADFAVLSDRAAGGNLATDKRVYAPMDKAVVTVRCENTGLNTHLQELELRVSSRNPAGIEVWSDNAAIAYLPAGQNDARVFHWPLDGLPGGEYTVQASLSCGEEVLWSAGKTVEVRAEAALTGALTVVPRQTRAGENVDFAYTLTNIGNMPLDSFELQILLVRPETGEIGLTIARALTLEPGSSLEDIAPQPIGLPDARYMAVMQAVIDGKTVPLDGDDLLVDSTPPVTAANLTELRFIKDGVFYGVIGSALTLAATDNLSGVAETLYDLGQGWTRYEGPVPFKAEGVYEARFKSIDRLGNTEDERTIGIVIDQTPPVARVVSPAEGAVVPPEFTVTVEAWDNLALDSAELYVDGERVAGFGVSPAEIALSLAPSPHTLRARAIDRAEFEAWSPPVEIQVGISDTIPPVTRIDLAGERWCDGAYKPGVTVTLTATDNEGGTGVAFIHYRIDCGGEKLYTGPFLLQTEGVHTISYYAVDHSGNREALKTAKVRIVKPWAALHDLLCEELTAKGRAELGSVFSNGDVNLAGNVRLAYLGTTRRCINKTHKVKIGKLDTNERRRDIPEPDWGALRARTELRRETRLSGHQSLENVRFAKDLKITGQIKVEGLLVVEGDLTINGNLELNGAVYCRGKVSINGQAFLNGLLYAGKELRVGGTLVLHGAAVVDGPVEFHGNVRIEEVPLPQAVRWLRLNLDCGGGQCGHHHDDHNQCGRHNCGNHHGGHYHNWHCYGDDPGCGWRPWSPW